MAASTLQSFGKKNHNSPMYNALINVLTAKALGQDCRFLEVLQTKCRYIFKTFDAYCQRVFQKVSTHVQSHSEGLFPQTFISTVEFFSSFLAV